MRDFLTAIQSSNAIKWWKNAKSRIKVHTVSFFQNMWEAYFEDEDEFEINQYIQQVSKQYRSESKITGKRIDLPGFIFNRNLKRRMLQQAAGGAARPAKAPRGRSTTGGKSLASLGAVEIGRKRTRDDTEDDEEEEEEDEEEEDEADEEEDSE